MYLHKWSTKKTWKYTTDIQDKPLFKSVLGAYLDNISSYKDKLVATEHSVNDMSTLKVLRF